jgi:hypothetical protein
MRGAAAGTGIPLPDTVKHPTYLPRMDRGIRNESAPVTTIDSGHPLLNTKDERRRIHAVLRHLGSGADLRDFPVSQSEKIALVKTASQRRLIAWHKGRSRYEVTPAGWCELAPSRRFGVGSMMMGTALGASVGAVALAVFWFATGPAHAPPRPLARSAPAHVAAVSPPAPAVTGSVSRPAPVAPSTPAAALPAAPTPPAVATPPAQPAPAAAPVEATPVEATPVEAVPAKVAEGPTQEQRAEAAKAKAAARKARQRAAAKRRREEAARAWAAADPSRTREAEYAGHGVYGYGGNGGQNSWFAYR